MNVFFLLWRDWWCNWCSAFRHDLAMFRKFHHLPQLSTEDIYEVQWLDELLLFRLSWLGFCIYPLWKLLACIAGLDPKFLDEQREEAIVRIKKKRGEITEDGGSQK
jgi:hypothetical protein